MDRIRNPGFQSNVADPGGSVFKSPAGSGSVFDVPTDPDPASEIELGAGTYRTYVLFMVENENFPKFLLLP